MLPIETLQCPYCGEYIEVAIDDSIDLQQYTEDCQVCCRPMVLRVRVEEDGSIAIQVRTEDEA